MSLLIRVFRGLISHPLISLGSFLALVLVLVFLQPCRSEPPAPDPSLGTAPEISKPGRTPALEPTAPLSPEQAVNRTKPAPDPYDYDPETKARVEKQLTEQPAVQGLPLDQRGVFADLTDILPDGRLLITVTYRTTEADGRQQWNSFLRRYQDNGQNYVVVYRSE